MLKRKGWGFTADSIKVGVRQEPAEINEDGEIISKGTWNNDRSDIEVIMPKMWLSF